MKSSILLRALSAIALIGAICANTKANEGTLLLDGRILVENGSMDNATVTVLQDAVELSKLTKKLDAFQLKLALGHSYTLVFTKPGYVTKELVFDTNTPMDTRKGSVFTFRFQVALSATPDAGDYRFDGPLAIIKFDSNEGEFGYDRQHAEPHMVKAAPARKRREAQAFVDPSAPLDAWVAEKRNNQ
jgi:hypothetical protein